MIVTLNNPLFLVCFYHPVRPNVPHTSVEGVDLLVPSYNFGETHYIPQQSVTDAYKAKLFALTGRVNSAAFRGLARGECLFRGASGSQRSEEDWEITFNFSASPNVTGLTVGDITGINKLGWEYLWVRYVDKEQTVGNAKYIVRVPQFAYVEQVYYFGDFSQLGIGA